MYKSTNLSTVGSKIRKECLYPAEMNVLAPVCECFDRYVMTHGTIMLLLWCVDS